MRVHAIISAQQMRGADKKIIAIMGPTAVGKTRAAIELARTVDGEIIGADSMQIYKHMYIGTAAPTREELASVPHHLVGEIDPSEPISVAGWLERATDAISDIVDRGKVPIVAGGSGLYFRAIFDGLFEAPDPDPEIRSALRERAKVEDLYPELQRVDPDAARNIHPNDAYRIVRAIEVYRQTGIPISEHWSKQRPPEGIDSLRVGLEIRRQELHNRINDRAQRMIESGLIEEVKRLIEMGYKRDIWPMRHFGYRYVWSHIEGELDLEEALRLLARDTRRYARRQLTWFRGVADIKWFDPGEDLNAIIDTVKDFLRR